MVGRVDHAVGDDGVLEELLGLAHLGRSEKILKHVNKYFLKTGRTRSSWLNCELRDDEAVYWVTIGHCEALAIGN